MGTENQLKQVGVDRPVELAPSTKSGIDEAATAMLLLGLKTLSQRAVVALSNLFTLLTCVSAFVLWQDVLPSPNTYQLVGLAFYGIFILLLHIVRRRYESK